MNPWTEGKAKAGDGLEENGPPPGKAGKTVGKPPISEEAASQALLDGRGYRQGGTEGGDHRCGVHEGVEM